jgi:hypothetical protein
MKALRTIRFDGSDIRVFEIAADEEEWLVSGASTFSHIERDDLTGKLRQAFANGFLGVETFGHSTFACVARIEEEELDDLHATFAAGLASRLGAPAEVALEVASEEIGFMIDLCRDLPLNAVIAVTRELDDDGQIQETFRAVKSPEAEPRHARIWDVEDDDD